VDDKPVVSGDYARVRRVFRAGDRVVLQLPMPPRLVVANERIDATRGCVAVARGPLVYAIEQPDQDGEVVLEDLRLDPTAPLTLEHREDLLDGVTVLHTRGAAVSPDPHPYGPYGATTPPSNPADLTLIPYYAWSNRGPHAMRVWIPTH
jgi:DUF1680 family protein